MTKPELLHSLLDHNTLKYVYERHPGLIDAVSQLAIAVHEEKTKASNKEQNQTEAEVSNPFSYNLDEMSEDDDDEDMETGESRHRSRRSIGGITQDQLAAALRNAQSQMMGSGGGMSHIVGDTIKRS